MANSIAQIGHLEPAAGVASFIKGVLALEHSLIPPNIHFSKPNPAIPMDEWNMLVPTKLTPWPLCTTTKRMCVNSFGMGGSVTLCSHLSTLFLRDFSVISPRSPRQVSDTR